MKFFISGPLPGLNDMINEARGNKFASAVLKKKWTKRVSDTIFMKLGKVEPVKSVFINFVWVELHRRRDPDNIAAAKKFILDGMVDAGIIKNDGWKQVTGWADYFTVDKENPGVFVEVISANKRRYI